MADRSEQARRSYNRLSPVYAKLCDDSEKRFVAEAIEGMLRPLSMWGLAVDLVLAHPKQP